MPLLPSPSSAEARDISDATKLMIVRVAPFVMMAGVVYGRRTQLFHVRYVRATLRRPMSQHVDLMYKPASKNPMLDLWLARTLPSSKKRGLRVVSGDTLLGKSSTTLLHLATSQRRGLYVDLHPARLPKDVSKLFVQSIIAQSDVFHRLLSPLQLDVRTVLPLAVRPRWRRVPPWLKRYLSPTAPVIVVDSAENLFQKDEDGQDALGTFRALIETSRYAEVILLCSDEAALEHLLPDMTLAPFMEVMFCPEPPRELVSRRYLERTPLIFEGDARWRFAQRVAHLFRRAPALANELLRFLALGQQPVPATYGILAQAAESLTVRLQLGTPSAFVSPQEAELRLLCIECALQFAVSPSGRRAQEALVQLHDDAPRRLLQLGILRVETGQDGQRRLRLVQESAVIWALSGRAARRAVDALLRAVRRAPAAADCDAEQLGALAASVEDLMDSCEIAREVLVEWIRDHMHGHGPDFADDWRLLVEAKCGGPRAEIFRWNNNNCYAIHEPATARPPSSTEHEGDVVDAVQFPLRCMPSASSSFNHKPLGFS